MQRLKPFILMGCVLASPALSAHDIRPYWDFRFGLGADPPITDAEYDTPYGNYEQEWESAGGSLEFNVAHRFVSRGPSSAYLTVGTFLRGYGGEEDPWTTADAEVSVGAFGLQAGAGYSYRNGRYSLEIGPRIGFGGASATETYFGDEIESEDDGDYFRWDLGVTNALTFNKFQFGATVGLAAWQAEVRYAPQIHYDPSGSYVTAPADATYSGSGAYVLMFIGFR
jgi:hypothetical protein